MFSLLYMQNSMNTEHRVTTRKANKIPSPQPIFLAQWFYIILYFIPQSFHTHTHTHTYKKSNNRAFPCTYFILRVVCTDLQSSVLTACHILLNTIHVYGNHNKFSLAQFVAWRNSWKHGSKIGTDLLRVNQLLIFHLSPLSPKAKKK